VLRKVVLTDTHFSPEKTGTKVDLFMRKAGIISKSGESGVTPHPALLIRYKSSNIRMEAHINNSVKGILFISLFALDIFDMGLDLGGRSSACSRTCCHRLR
jgi:hypothetical protein